MAVNYCNMSVNYHGIWTLEIVEFFTVVIYHEKSLQKFYSIDSWWQNLVADLSWLILSTHWRILIFWTEQNRFILFNPYEFMVRYIFFDELSAAPPEKNGLEYNTVLFADFRATKNFFSRQKCSAKKFSLNAATLPLSLFCTEIQS